VLDRRDYTGVRSDIGEPLVLREHSDNQTCAEHARNDGKAALGERNN
jgi:hypothetical protein